MEFLGNKSLLELPKVAFLCSRRVPATAVLKCYDWAIAQRDLGVCVISGFQSQIEKDVFHFLAKGDQPIILVLARGMREKFEPKVMERLNSGTLLVVSPFSREIIRATEVTAFKRNQYIINLANQVVLGYCRPNGNLDQAIRGKNKKMLILGS